jgi:hypothetical protein
MCLMGVLVLWLVGLFGEPVAVEGEGEPEADHCIWDGDAGEDEDAEAGEEDEAGVEAGSGAGFRSLKATEGAAGEGFDDECQRENCECEWETGGGGADAEEFEAGGHAPVEERGLFEVADTVGVEGDPVVAEEHLAGDLGVDGVGVVEQWWGDEGEACVEEEPESEKDKAVALDFGLSEGCVHGERFGRNKKLPRRLKPHCSEGFMARLKSRPFKTTTG